MIRMFIYFVFFGLLLVIFLNIFDVKFGKWYVNIHLKDYIVDGLKSISKSRKDLNGTTTKESKTEKESVTEEERIVNEKKGKKADKNMSEEDLDTDVIGDVIQKIYQMKKEKR
jgi:transcription initiation factor IIF auxiliary subunit